MTYLKRTDFRREVHALLGLPFDAVTQQTAVTRLRNSMRNRTPCLWVTPNVNFVVACRNDHDFRTSILKAELSTVDGMPLVWLARLLGIPLRERVAGADVFDRLCQSNAEAEVFTVFLYGGDDGVAHAAHDALNARGSAMRSVGWLSPGRGSVDELSRPKDQFAIRGAHPDFLLVSLGAVKGHLWIDQNWSEVGTPVVSHLGAVINFLAGTVKRAPIWMQSFGMEWLWRIHQEYALILRYYNDGKIFLPLFAKTCVRYFLSCRKWNCLLELYPPDIQSKENSDHVVWILSGIFTREGLGSLRDLADGLNHKASDLVIDLSLIRWLDSAAMGVLLLVYAHQSRNGFSLVWRGDVAKSVFAAHGCEYLLQ